jgi:hypothetical protein
MRGMRMAILIAAGLLAAGCGKKQDAAPEASADPGAGSEAPSEAAADPKKDVIEACHLKMTAPEVREWITSWDPRGKRSLGEGPSVAHSTYWGNEQERKALADNHTPVLEISCSAEGDDHQMVIGLNLSTVLLTEQEVPLGPGTYQIVERQMDETKPPNKGIYVAPLLYAGSVFWEAKSGTLTLTRFDRKGVAGSFSFEGQERLTGQRPIHVEGTFEIPCRGGVLEAECKANKAITD